jgi:hypothetical protein
MITTLFWKTFYRFKLGDDYTDALKSAKLTSLSTKQASKGDLSTFYNMKGERIRGWHRPVHAKKCSASDPMAKYLDGYK